MALRDHGRAGDVGLSVRRRGPLLQIHAAIIGISVVLQFGSTPSVFGTLSSMLVGCGVAPVVNYPSWSIPRPVSTGPRDWSWASWLPR